MPDWKTYVRQRLSLPGVRPERQAEIVEDVGRQLDEAYREALVSGASEAEARAAAEGHVDEWDALADALQRSRRDRQPIIDRWQDRADDRELAAHAGPSLHATIRQDLLSAWRLILHSRTIAAIVVLSLAVGIAGNTAIFTVIDALLLRSLPVSQPDALVAISDPAASGMGTGTQDGVRTLFSEHEFEGLRDHNDVLSDVLAFSAFEFRVPASTTADDHDPVASVVLASGTFFSTLGIHPTVGRVFGPEVDAVRMANPVVVVSDAFWHQRLAGSANAIGRSVRVRGTPFTIIGVLPPSFIGLVVGNAPDMYVPITMQEAIAPGEDWLTQPVGVARRTMFLHIVGRLKPGISLAAANAALNVTFRRDLETEAATIANADRRRDLLDAHLVVTGARRGLSPLRGQYARPLGVLLGLMGLLLLLACTNVANLLLARANSRRRELALRVALGASRSRLVRQLLTESVVLAAIGAAVGLWLSRFGVDVLLRLVSPNGSRVPLDVPLNATVLGFTAALAIATGLLFGVLPALRATQVDLNSVFGDTTTRVVGNGRSRGRWPLGASLAASQVALSVVLLVAAGLFVRSLGKLSAVSLGYEATHLLMFDVEPQPAGYSPTTVAPAYERVLASLAAVPGIQRASLSENGLFYGKDSADAVSFPDDPMPPGLNMGVRFDIVGPGYFSTVGIPIIEGRDVDADDAIGTRSCWLAETTRRRFFPTEDPVGRRMIVHYSFTDETCQIRGIVRDARQNELRDTPHPRVYMPFFGAATHPTGVVFILRTAGGPRMSAGDVSRILRTTMPGVDAPEFQTVSDRLYQQLNGDRLMARLSLMLGAMAVVLAGIGIYGVLSYSVARRTSEIGVRMALGATRGQVLGLIGAEALVLAGAGAIIGVGIALAAARVLGSLLFQLSPRDPVTMGVVLLIVSAASLAASVLPAWRAARTDPIAALRAD